jgi:hypothetical protein
MFIAAFFIPALIWKQSGGLPLGEYLTILWYIHTVVYDSAIKRNDMQSNLNESQGHYAERGKIMSKCMLLYT